MKTKRRRQTPSQPSATRRALYMASSLRRTRTIQTRWLTFRTPAQLLKDAAAMVPEWCVQHVSLFRIEEATTPAYIRLGFGNLDGENLSVSVMLQPEDVNRVLLYMVAHDMTSAVWIDSVLPDDDGSGEALDVPTVSEAELVEMVPAGGVQ